MNIKKIINKFLKKDEIVEYVSDDWRDLRALPKEVLAKRKLDAMQKDVLDELNRQVVAEPQAIFYCHKYIDAKFSKTDFDVDTYFLNAQNDIDQKYAEGLGEILVELSEYDEMVEQLEEYKVQMYYLAGVLNPDIETPAPQPSNYQSDKIHAKFDELPKEIEWSKLGE